MKSQLTLILFCFTLAITVQLNRAQGQIPSYVASNGLQGYFPLDGNGTDVSLHFSVIGSNMAYAKDRHGNSNRAALFNSQKSFFTTSYASTFSLYNWSGITVSMWFNIFDTANYEQKLFQIASYYDVVLDISFTKGKTAQLTFLNSKKGNPLFRVTLDSIPTTGTWHHSTLSIDRNSSVANWYLDGEKMQSWTYTTFDWPSYNKLNFGNDYQSSMVFKGMLDEIGMWDRALDEKEIIELYAEKKCDFKVTQSANVGVLKGVNGQLWASSSQSGSTMQWQVTDSITGDYINLRNGGRYSGATDSILHIYNADPTLNNKLFRCKFSYGTCSDFSQPMRFYCYCSTNMAPYSDSADLGDTAAFSVASNDPNAQFRWQSSTNIDSNDFYDIGNSVNAFGSATNFLQIAPVARELSGSNYRCIISSHALSCIDTTTSVKLFANCRGNILYQPQDYYSYIGTDANMATESILPNTTYQWQIENGGVYENLKSTMFYIGETSQNLIIRNTTIADDQKKYRCVLANSDCKTYTKPATLHVTWPANIAAKEKNAITFWPNPCSDLLNLHCDQDCFNDNCILYDLSGKIILIEKIFNIETPIKMKGIAAGVYIMKIKEQTFKIYKINN